MEDEDGAHLKSEERKNYDQGNETGLPGDLSEDMANPFRLPSDEEVFVTREAEKRRLLEQKEKNIYMKIWEKKTASTQAGLKRPKETDIPPAERREELQPGKTKKKELIQAALDIVKGRLRGGSGKDLGEKKQGMQEFVDQKKEMFLVVKTTGILENAKVGLEKKAKKRELALDQAEKHMEKNKQDFKAKKSEQDAETKKYIEELEAYIQQKAGIDEELSKLEQDETNTRQKNKNNIEREENLWTYKQFHDKVANKEWLAKQPLEIEKKRWVEMKLHN